MDQVEQGGPMNDLKAKEDKSKALVRLNVLSPDGEINVGPLLASEWWPVTWRHKEYAPQIHQRKNRTVPEALEWYHSMLETGWQPYWWVHPSRGQLRFNGREWR